MENRYKKIQKIIKKADKYSYGIDYCRIIIASDDDIDNNNNLYRLYYMINTLDTDNSNIATMAIWKHRVNIIKMTTKKWVGILGSIIYDWIVAPLFFFEKYDKNTKKISKVLGNIVYYGIYYRLLEIGYISKNEEFYLFFQKINDKKRISRLDFRFDFFYQKKTELFKAEKITKIKKNTKYKLHMVWDICTGWSLGSRDTKRYIIRAYDKLLDSSLKWKFIFYKDYFKFKSVNRLEFEFLNHFCKKYTYDRMEEFLIYILDYLKADVNIWNIYESKNNTSMEEVQDRYKYYSRTRSMMKTCIENWINIFGIIEEIFIEIWKNEKEIKEIFIEYLKFKKLDWNFYEKIDDIELVEYIRQEYKVFL